MVVIILGLLLYVVDTLDVGVDIDVSDVRTSCVRAAYVSL